MTIEALLQSLREKLAPKRKASQTCAPPIAFPTRDWLILLIVGLLFFICGGVWAGLTYLGVEGGQSASPQMGAVSAGPPALDETALSQVLSLSDVRAQKRATLRAQ